MSFFGSRGLLRFGFLRSQRATVFWPDEVAVSPDFFVSLTPSAINTAADPNARTRATTCPRRAWTAIAVKIHAIIQAKMPPPTPIAEVGPTDEKQQNKGQELPDAAAAA